MPLQQLPEEPDGGAPISPRLDQDVEEVAVLVHRSPQVLLAPVECDEDETGDCDQSSDERAARDAHRDPQRQGGGRPGQ